MWIWKKKCSTEKNLSRNKVWNSRWTNIKKPRPGKRWLLQGYLRSLLRAWHWQYVIWGHTISIKFPHTVISNCWSESIRQRAPSHFLAPLFPVLSYPVLIIACLKHPRNFFTCLLYNNDDYSGYCEHNSIKWYYFIMEQL